jgi:hypothetical protein
MGSHHSNQTSFHTMSKRPRQKTARIRYAVAVTGVGVSMVAIVTYFSLKLHFVVNSVTW